MPENARVYRSSYHREARRVQSGKRARRDAMLPRYLIRATRASAVRFTPRVANVTAHPVVAARYACLSRAASACLPRL